MMQVLLWYKAAHSQNILPFFDAQLPKVFWIVTEFWLWYTIVYQMYMFCSVIFSFY